MGALQGETNSRSAVQEFPPPFLWNTCSSTYSQ